MDNYEIVRQVRRYLTTIELDMFDDPATIERCACESIKLLGQLAVESKHYVYNSVSLQASNGAAGISGAPPACS